MKCNLILSVLLISLAILPACKGSKGNDEEKTYSNSLQGSWELREVRGGMVAGASPYYAPGNGHRWEFQDSSFKRFAAGTLVSSGAFTLTRDTCPATQTMLDAFITENSYGHRLFFEISRDTLTIYDGVIAADGTIEKYVRVNAVN